MKQPERDERRTFDRLSAYHLAKYKIADLPDAGWVDATVMNVGGGGVYLRANQELSVSTIIKVRILFHGAPGLVSATAKVVWVKQSRIKDNIYFDSGLQFLDISDKLQKEIISRIERVRRRISADKGEVTGE